MASMIDSLCSMSKTFRSWDVDQVWLLPPSIHDFVPSGYAAHFVRETVRESLDLSAILDVYAQARGQPPYHPMMMTALLLYAYSTGIYSSRRIARACEERVDFMAVTGLQKPDFRTISDFRKRHLEALSGLFVQVLELCRAAGLAKLRHVALDGTKIKANASKHKAMSYGRMLKAEAALEAEVAAWLDKAARADASEDRELGTEVRGDEMPTWVADKQARLAKIKEAKAVLEAEAKAAAEAKAEAKARRRRPSARQAARQADAEGEPPSDKPADKAQRNFTDPESRILKTKDGFIQGYNAQAAVEAARPWAGGRPSGDRRSWPDRQWQRSGATEADGRGGRDHGRRAAQGTLRRQRLLLRGQPRVPRGSRHQRLCRRGAPAPWPEFARRPPALPARQPGRGDAAQAQARRPRKPIPPAQDHRRAGVRPDQASPWLPVVPP